MIVDIIPTKKMPKNLSVLSYKIPKDLEGKVKIGQLVSLPLRSSITQGIVVDIAKTKKLPYKLKNILNLVNPKPIFTHQQLKLFQELANYYHVSASLFVHFNLPKLIKKDWDKLNTIPFQPFNPLQPFKAFYHWWSNLDERNKFYLKQTKQTNGQILIIIPRISDIFNLADQLKLQPNQYTPIHRQLSRKDNFKTYLQAISYKLTPNASLFIGTRSSLFYPFTNLKTIIIDDEHSQDHKQYDMNPRYDAKIVAEKIRQIYKTQIIFSSPSPSLVAYNELNPKSKSLNRKINLIDLNNELTKKNYSFISEQLFNNIKKTLNSKKSVFLFVNKKGESSTTSCRDCNFIFNCPICQLPLIKSKTNKLTCYYCNHHEDLPPFCPKCSGPNFKSTGLGIQKVETNLKNLFPKANIIRLDKDIKNPKAISYKLKAIIIGTQFALDKINWDKIHLLGIINADNLWHHAEFMATENAYQQLIKLLTLVPKNANIVIQTFNPDHYIIQSILNNKPEIFYAQELKFRKQFNYPPYTNLIKLSYLNQSPSKAQKEANKIYQKLNKLNKNVNSPMPILRRKIRNKYKYNIVLKLNNLNDFKSLVKHIPNDWLIDIHPRTLLD